MTNKPNPIKWIKKEILVGEYIHVYYPCKIDYIIPADLMYSDIDTPARPVKFDGEFFYTEYTEPVPVDKVEVHGKFRSFWKRLFHGK